MAERYVLHNTKLTVGDGKPLFEPPRFRRSDIDELAKASTAGKGNRKERRRRQAEFKKLMRKG